MQVAPKEQAYKSFLTSQDYPCVGAKAAVSAGNITCMVAGSMNDNSHDEEILHFLYDFVQDYRESESRFHSAAVIFEGPEKMSEEIFEKLIWVRLQSLHDLDSLNYAYDKRVNPDPSSADFSFSIREEAMFIIGLHPESSRKARRFKCPALTFNPHDQFNVLKETGKYESFKHTVRTRDIAYSGSINPMLTDFGNASETRQYSGMKYDDDWQCPLIINHG
jgi:uncharacterized protein